MNLNFKLLFIVISSIGLFSCTPDPIELKLKSEKLRLVINPKVLSAELVLVGLSRTYDPGKEVIKTADELLVDGAEIILNMDGQEFRAERVEKGLYLFQGLSLNEFQNYSIKISAPGFEDLALSSSKYFEAPQIPSFSVERLFKNDGTDTFYRANLEIQKPNNREKSFYMLQLASPDTSGLRRSIPRQGVNLDFFTSFEDPWNGVYLFEVNQWNNNSIQIQHDFYLNNHTDTMLLLCTELDYSYFQYLEKLKSQGHILQKMMQAGFNVKGNIANAYGYFNLFESRANHIEF